VCVGVCVCVCVCACVCMQFQNKIHQLLQYRTVDHSSFSLYVRMTATNPFLRVASSVKHSLNDKQPAAWCHGLEEMVQNEGSILIRPVLQDILQQVAVTAVENRCTLYMLQPPFPLQWKPGNKSIIDISVVLVNYNYK